MRFNYFTLKLLLLAFLCSHGYASNILDEPVNIFSNIKARYNHTALPYNATMKEEIKEFYGKTLGLRVIDAGKENLLVDFLGINLVFHASHEPLPNALLHSTDHPVPHVHFGTHDLTLNEFIDVERSVEALNIKVGRTLVLNHNQENEERTLFFKDPTGYVIECRYTLKKLDFNTTQTLIMDKEKQGFN